MREKKSRERCKGKPDRVSLKKKRGRRSYCPQTVTENPKF
jgi:hypothetical protein